jgi:hypothetical protein
MAAVTMCACGRQAKPNGRFCSGCYARGAAKANAPASTAAVVGEAFSVAGDTALVSKASTERVRTLDDLVRVCEIDTAEWDIIEWSCKASQQASVPRATRPTADKKWTRPTTEPVLVQMFHVSAKLRRRAELIAVRKEIAALVADAKRAIAPRKAPAIVRPSAGLMLELDIFDLHIGKLAWGVETGHGPYDTKLAVGAFDEALDVLLARTGTHKFDRVLFPIGNDVLHSDGKANQTTAGTPQDVDGRYHKVFLTARRMFVAAIEQRLARIAPLVIVPIVPGNHDEHAAWHLGDSLDCWFHSSKRIQILNHPTPRKYVRHGKVLLGFTHGNEEKLADLPQLMATEQPEAWGATRIREFHIGHRHKEMVDEKMGFKTRTLSALCAADSWHAKKGYVGNARAAEAFVWDAEEGRIAGATFTMR